MLQVSYDKKLQRWVIKDTVTGRVTIKTVDKEWAINYVAKTNYKEAQKKC